MASTIGDLRPRSKKKLFLLVIFVIGTLTVVSLMLILQSFRTEQTPQSPSEHPISRVSGMQTELPPSQLWTLG